MKRRAGSFSTIGSETVAERNGEFIIVQFGKMGRKQLIEKVYFEKELIEAV